MEQTITYRKLQRDEIALFGQIDRRETIEAFYHWRDGVRVLLPQRHVVPAWSEAFKWKMITRLEALYDTGAGFHGAFAGDSLIGMAVLDYQPVRTGERRLNLDGLWVSHAFRNQGVGKALFMLAVGEARRREARALYVSATPSENTVRFYERLGCRPAQPVDPTLFDEEPEDIHLEYHLLGDAAPA